MHTQLHQAESFHILNQGTRVVPLAVKVLCEVKSTATPRGNVSSVMETLCTAAMQPSSISYSHQPSVQPLGRPNTAMATAREDSKHSKDLERIYSFQNSIFHVHDITAQRNSLHLTIQSINQPYRWKNRQKKLESR